MKVVYQYGENWNDLQKLQCFVTSLTGISTNFYYKELIGIGAKPDFALGLNVRDIGKLILIS